MNWAWVADVAQIIFADIILSGDNALVISDDEIQWSGPPGVIALATSSDVQLTY